MNVQRFSKSRKKLALGTGAIVLSVISILLLQSDATKNTQQAFEQKQLSDPTSSLTDETSPLVDQTPTQNDAEQSIAITNMPQQMTQHSSNAQVSNEVSEDKVTPSTQSLKLNMSNKWTGTLELSGNSHFEIVSISNKPEVITVTRNSYLDSPVKKHVTVALTQRPIKSSGSMEIIFTVKNMQSNSTKDIAVIADWEAFKYIVSLDGFTFTPPTAISAIHTADISISQVPDGDTPSVNYELSIFDSAQKKNRLYVTNSSYRYESMPWTAMQLPSLSISRGKTYYYELRVTMNGWSTYQHTFTGEFTY